MAWLKDVTHAAQESWEQGRLLRKRLRDAQERLVPPPAPPTLTLDRAGHAVPERAEGALAALGRSLALLLFSALALGVSWLTTGLLALYLLAQRLYGLQIRLARGR